MQPTAQAVGEGRTGPSPSGEKELSSRHFLDEYWNECERVYGDGGREARNSPGPVPILPYGVRTRFATSGPTRRK
jgi:hypothetical protein